MTKIVEAVVHNNGITEGKIYEVIDETNNYYPIEDDSNCKTGFPKTWFKEVEEPTKETNAFKFIPETDITYVTVNGVKGILIKE